MTERFDLTVSRNQTWRDTIDVPYLGAPLPLTGANVRMQWRHYEGAPGSPLLDLTNVPFIDLAATDEDPAADPDLRILRLSPVAPKEALEDLPSGLNQPEPGQADRFVYDVIVTYADTAADRLLQGFIYLNKGTTRG